MMTKGGYEKYVYLAMIGGQCNRFEEMAEFLEQLLNSRNKDLNNSERNLLSVTYKSSVSIRTIIAYELKEWKRENSAFLH